MRDNNALVIANIWIAASFAIPSVGGRIIALLIGIVWLVKGILE